MHTKRMWLTWNESHITYKLSFLSLRFFSAIMFGQIKLFNDPFCISISTFELYAMYWTAYRQYICFLSIGSLSSILHWYCVIYLELHLISFLGWLWHSADFPLFKGDRYQGCGHFVNAISKAWKVHLKAIQIN